MHHTISQQTRTELLEALRQRYKRAFKTEKTKALDEFVAVAGCHRKHAIRLLARACRAGGAAPHAVSRRTYDEAVRQALVVLWEAADRICGKRLKAVLPGLVAALERNGHLKLDPVVRQHLLSASPATIDRLLAPVRGAASGRRKRKTATKQSKQVPIRTFADWNEPPPGYLEIDFVSHGGSSVQGAFLWSLVATDVCSGWTEAVPWLAREQSLVVEGLEVIRRQLPIPILGIDSDNDGAFINDTLLAYCREHRLEFTRSRAYRKNDQAWIEQKNGAVVRRFVGYERLSGMIAGVVFGSTVSGHAPVRESLPAVVQAPLQGPSGAKMRKVYHKPATPCERLLAHAAVAEAVKEQLRCEGGRLDPLELLHRIREAQAVLATLASEESDIGAGRESLEQFLARLPELWRAGEARPTHRQGDRPPRSYRTRKDPFEGVWSDNLLWLQEDPEATAKSLLERLHEEYPGRFPEGQLRTLQRRIREWRRVMARELVYACLGGKRAVEVPPVIGANGER